MIQKDLQTQIIKISSCLPIIKKIEVLCLKVKKKIMKITGSL